MGKCIFKLIKQEFYQNSVMSEGLLEQILPLDDVGLNLLDIDITVNEINTAMAINNANKGKASGRFLRLMRDIMLRVWKPLCGNTKVMMDLQRKEIKRTKRKEKA